MSNDADIMAFIQSEMILFGIEFQKSRRDFLKRKISASGGLAESIQIEHAADKQSRQETISMLISFEEHGRFIDMKRLRGAYGGAELVKELQEWIKIRGWESKFVEAYTRKHHLRKVTPRILAQIAWGIIRSRSRKNNQRQKKWWNKYKSAAIPDFFNRIASQLPIKAKETLFLTLDNRQ